MNWQPIESYDNLEIKPKLAVFRFKEEMVGRTKLRELFEFSKHCGSRTCTDWIELPEFSASEALLRGQE